MSPTESVDPSKQGRSSNEERLPRFGGAVLAVVGLGTLSVFEAPKAR